MKIDFEKYLSNTVEIIEKRLSEYVRVKDFGLSDAMEYSLLSPGKRLRPFMVIESARLFNKNVDLEAVLPFACALEMIHCYSLIHDDLPCMDNDDLRRGRPTNHKVFGEAKALLAGDALLTYAFEVLASNERVSDKSIRLATIALSHCSGHFGMAGGQIIDLDESIKITSYNDLKRLHELKTANLLKCAMQLGYFAVCDTPNDEALNDISTFATNLGIAFQIKDDILDVTADEATLGKPIGSDEKNGKITSLAFMSLNEAQDEVDRLTNNSIKIIEKYYSKNDYKALVYLSEYLTSREK